MNTIQAIKLQSSVKLLSAFTRTLAAVGLVACLLIPAKSWADDKAAAQKNLAELNAAKAQVEQLKNAYGSDLEVVNGSLLWTGPKRKDNATKLDATLNVVVELLREQHPDANFIVAPGLANVGISDFKLRNASAREALQAICIASGSSVGWRDDSAAPTGVDPATGLPVAVTGQPSKPMYVLFELPQSDYDVNGNIKPKLQVEAFGLGGYFDSQFKAANPKELNEIMEQEVKELEKIVYETADQYGVRSRELNPSSKTPRTGLTVRFHRSARLLVVMGDAEGVAVAAKVIGALPGVRHSGSGDLPSVPGAGGMRGESGGLSSPDPFGAPGAGGATHR